MTTIPNSKAAQPNKALEPFRILIGAWKTVGKHPLFPGVSLMGTTTFKWLENGAFMQMNNWINHEQFPDGIAIFGSDSSTQEYTMIYFDERGISRKYNCTFQDNTLRWWRNDPEFSQQFQCQIQDNGKTIISKGKMSRNGKPWEDDLELEYTRIDL